MKTLAVMLLTDVGRCEYFFLLFFNLNSCCFPYSASNVLAFLVLVLHGILTEKDALCCISLLCCDTYVCYTLECVSGNLPGMGGRRQRNSFWGMRVRTSTGAGKHGHGTFFATTFCEFVNRMRFLIKATTKPFNLHN